MYICITSAGFVIQKAASHRSSPSHAYHFHFPPVMHNFNFQRCCPGLFAGLLHFTWSQLNSLRVPHCPFQLCPSCFFFPIPSPPLPLLKWSICKGLRSSVPCKTTAHLTHKLARKHKSEDKFTQASSQGPESPTNSLLQLQFTEFIIVLGGALQSNQNDNNSQKLQWAVWKD